MENAALEIGVRYIKGVGESREKLMGKLGIHTLRDLVGYFPRAYEDRTVFKKINGLAIGETVCVRAMAAAAPSLSHIRKGLDLTKLRAVDDTGSLEITFFNQPYTKDSIKQGEEYVFYGKISGTLLKPEMTNPLYERYLNGPNNACICPDSGPFTENAFQCRAQRIG
jgi:ATP-dependent DNA helicase RecG